MSKSETARKIEVMQAFEDGRIVEYRHKLNDNKQWWILTSDTPSWEWPAYNYRIKEGKPVTLQSRIEAEFEGYEVVMLEDDRDILMLYRFGHEFKHIEAQSMKGFAGYIYNCGKHVIQHFQPIFESGTKQLHHPVAVLFERGES